MTAAGPMDAAAHVTAIVGRCADEVETRYVLPDVAREAADVLRRRLASGTYATARPAAADLDAPALALALTTDLQGVTHDLHLRVVHHPEGVPRAEDPQAHAAHWREQARRTAGGIRRVERLDGNVAHLVLGPVLTVAAHSHDAVTAAMALVADSDALLLDVRDCLGGDPDTVQLLLSHVVGEDPVRLADLDSRDEGLRQRWTQPVAPRRFGPDRPLAVLTSARTFSGGEEIAFDVRDLGRGRVVGERTRGGANPRVGVTLDDELELTLPVARALSPRTGGSWEGTGVEPDVECPAEEALDRALELLRRDR